MLTNFIIEFENTNAVLQGKKRKSKLLKKNSHYTKSYNFRFLTNIIKNIFK